MKINIVFIFLIILPFHIYLKHNNLDIRTKSKHGWMRIINSEEKRLQYNLKLNPEEIKEYTKELEKLYIKDKEGGLL